jgi:hypothetical protein
MNVLHGQVPEQVKKIRAAKLAGEASVPVELSKTQENDGIAVVAPAFVDVVAV